MAIPKTIYQTFKTKNIPFITRFYIWRFRKKNKNYRYEFYDDQRMDEFIKDHFEEAVYRAFTRIQIGAAKADFFRYAILYVQGGIYLDLDSDISASLDKHLSEDDVAVIAKESNDLLYAQWALIYEKNHPFLARTISYIIDNINQNTFPHDVHSMTGPTVYSKAIRDELSENPDTPYRIAKNDYGGFMKFKYKLGKFFIYKNKNNHWKKLQTKIPVLRPVETEADHSFVMRPNVTSQASGKLNPNDASFI